MIVTTGTRLGRCEIDSQLGAGAMGDDYLVEDWGKQIATSKTEPMAAFAPSASISLPFCESLLIMVTSWPF
jgi:hypothetical protein